MIFESLEILRFEIDKHLAAQTGDSNLAVLENVSKIKDETLEHIVDKVLISLINIKEEIALKNKPNVMMVDGLNVYKNKPIHAHLYIMVASNRSDYGKSLQALAAVMEYFQAKTVFTQINTPLNPDIEALSSIKEFKFTVELFTPTFEQLAPIWTALGGHSIPNAIYKVSVVKIERDVTKKTGPAITEISSEITPQLS